MAAPPAEQVALALLTRWAVDHGAADYGAYTGYHDLQTTSGMARVRFEEVSEVMDPQSAPLVYFWLESVRHLDQDIAIGSWNIEAVFRVEGFTTPFAAGITSTATGSDRAFAAVRLANDLLLAVSKPPTSRQLGLTSTPVCVANTIVDLSAVNGDHALGSSDYGIVMGTVTVQIAADMGVG